MISQLSKFLKGRYTNDFPLLLAFSGGPDSLALLHLLLEFKKKQPLRLAVAHVDHGWRQESFQEAREIAAMIEGLGLPFYLHALDPKVLKGNLEEACREERLKFFAKICKQHGYQAVLLAHHADDVAETVLKRTLEGATLSRLSGIRPETEIHEMRIWRPLLDVTKADILKWLNDHNLEGLTDKTNFDAKFLRPRMRTQIIPHLSDMFGKEVSSGLCQISTESEELQHYLDGQVQQYLAKKVDGRLASFLDLSIDCPQKRFELKHLIRLFCKSHSFDLSREALASAVQIVLEKRANKTLLIGGGADLKILYLDRGFMFIPSAEFFKIENNWELKLEPFPSGKPILSDWKSLLQFGKGEAVLPLANYRLGNPTTSLSKWWTAHKVPSFFRLKIPVIIENGRIVHEFLTGKRQKGDLGDRCVKITLEFKSQKPEG